MAYTGFSPTTKSDGISDIQLFDADTGTFILDCGSNVVPEVCVVPFAVRSRDIAVDIVITSVVGAGTYTLTLDPQ